MCVWSDIPFFFIEASNTTPGDKWPHRHNRYHFLYFFEHPTEKWALERLKIYLFNSYSTFKFDCKMWILPKREFSPRFFDNSFTKKKKGNENKRNVSEKFGLLVQAFFIILFIISLCSEKRSNAYGKWNWIQYTIAD